MKYSKKNFSKVLPLIVALGMNNTLIFASNDTEYMKTLKSDFDVSKYSAEVSNNLTLILNGIESFKNSNNIEGLKDTIDLFSELPLYMTQADIDNSSRDDVFEYIFYSIRDFIYDMKGTQLKDMLIYYSENIFLGWRINKKVDMYGSKFLVKGLVEFNKGKNNDCQSRLDYLKGLYYYFLDNIDLDFDSGVIPDIDLDNSGGDKPGSDSLPGDPANPDYDFKPDESNPEQGGTNTDDNFSKVTDGNFVDYQKKESKCYKVSISYKDGKEVSRRESLLPKSDFVKCGIYDFVHSNSKRPTSNTTIDKDYIYGDQNLDSKYSIYYTINKRVSHPYYFDTGIKTSAIDNSVSYNQLKDALYQLSIKAEGFSVNDNDKFLSIVEGKPIVLKSQKNKYSKNEVERLLNSFNNVSLKIMESSEGKQYSLEKSLSSGEVKIININGERIELNDSAILLSNSVLLPIQDLAINLGAEIRKHNESTIITIGKNSLQIIEGKIDYIKNGSDMKFNTPPVVRDGLLFVEAEHIAKAFGYELSWDSDLGELNFNSI